MTTTLGQAWPEVEGFALLVMNGDLQKHVVAYYWWSRHEPIEDEL